MLATSHDDRYFARMSSSLGDKKRILDFVKPGKILDVGAGAGDLSEVLRLAGNDVYALDGSSEAIRRIQDKYPAVKAVTAYSYDVLELFEHHSFDTIICSSILHEIYSYGDPVNGTYSVDAALDALRSFFKLLKPGGKLVIRDGVMPTEWGREITMRLSTSDAVKYLEMYENKAPFYSERPGIRKVHFDKISENCFKGTLASAMEFLYTLTWGWGSAERETQELYGVFTEPEYCNVLENVGFTIEHAEQYLQEGYSEHLEGVTDIFDSFGNKQILPSSNMILVARRP